MSESIHTGFLQSAPGENSSGRLIKVASFIAACMCAAAGVIWKIDMVPYFLGFLGLAGGTEVVQKVTRQ